MSADDCERRFSITSEAYYGASSMETMAEDEVVAEVVLGLYDRNDGGAYIEFAIKWYSFGDMGKVAARVEVFEDTFKAFIELSDVFAVLAELDSTNPTVADIVNVLTGLNFKDCTARESPYEKKHG